MSPSLRQFTVRRHRQTPESLREVNLDELARRNVPLLRRANRGRNGLAR